MRDEVIRACVCVPAHDEQDTLPGLFEALARQDIDGRVRVIVTLNNCSDASVGVTVSAQQRYMRELDIVADRVRFPSELAHVGAARGRAMRLGAAWLRANDAAGTDQVLLTTDADAMPPPNWLRANLAAIDAGADCVGGRLVAREEASVDAKLEHHPIKRNHRSDKDARENKELEQFRAPFSAERALARQHGAIAAYWEAVRQLEDRLDPVVGDPAPRHGDHTGASIAVRRQVFEAVGGIPGLSAGEDTEFVRRVVAAGYRLRHAPDVWVAVSAREQGRAPGGMAAYRVFIREATARGADVLMPGADQWRDRIMWRAAVRAARGDAAVAQAECRLPRLRDDCVIGQATQDLRAACLVPCG